MFIRKKDLNDLKSKAGAAPQLQSQMAQLTHQLNAYKGQTGQQLAALEKELDFEDTAVFSLRTMERAYRALQGLSAPAKRTIKTVIKALESRLSEQEKLTRMILAHLGVEYAKTTEETGSGTLTKEVLRRAKRQGK
jgi:hypothetical protein